MKCVIIATPAHRPAAAHSHTATALQAVITRRLLPVVMLLLTVMTASAQTVKDEETLHVDFDGWFSTLVNNRKLYNRYNDSIFLIHDHDRWVEFFHTRAALNHDIYQSNKLCLDSLRQVITLPQAKNDARLYSDFIKSFFSKYINQNRSDPFLMLELCDLIDTLQVNRPDSLRFTNYLNTWRGSAYYHIWNMTHDDELLQKSYACYQRCVTDDAKRYPAYQSNYLNAMLQLCAYVWAQKKVETVDDLRERIKLARRYVAKHGNELSRKGYKITELKRRLNNADESMVRNIFLVDRTTIKKKSIDKLMYNLVQRNLRKPSLDNSSYLRTLIMQTNLKQITAKEALNRYRPRYRASMESLRNRRLDPQEFSLHLMPYYSLFYLNDLADIPYSAKRRNVLRMCRDIEMAFRHRSDRQSVTTFVNNLNVFVTYDRILSYLKPRERLAFLNKLSVSTHVTTYAHSVHVSEIAMVLMESLVDNQPQLLVGYLGCKTEGSVKRHKRRFVEFVREAALYHDLGKNTIIPVVDNDYRPLTDQEFKIVKRHPEMGLKYLALDPKLAKYHDTTLGHHKWYNGKGGYPADFDNTRSPYRIMIDIITLSDCMQAATERVGRNYKDGKTFDAVMGEMRRDAGTRYNPDLVSHIDAHPGLAQKLNHLLEDGWMDIYYNIYSQYFVRNR